MTMMKPIEDSTFLVVDSGLFLPLALRLAESAKRVIWHNPDRRGFPSLRQGSIGDGFDNLESTLDFWPMISDVDCAVFPDIGNSGLQIHLEEMGVPVWGSRAGDGIELKRQEFLKRLGDLGLDVPEYDVVVGVSALSDWLRDKEDQYVKVSRWRGDFETAHWRSWVLDEGWLDHLAVNFGPLKDLIPFIVLPAIDTDLEIGADTFFVGDWPSTMICGTEAKDKTYFGSVTKRSEMPDQIQQVLDAFGPYLKEHRYRNQFSMEVRVKGEKSYFIDPTCRGGMPSSASQYRLWRNFPEIVMAGAHGELIDPEPDAMFSIECQITCKPDGDSWVRVEIPKELEAHCSFSYCGFHDGCYVFPPEEFHHGELGWLVVTADTPTEVLEEAKRLADLLPDGLDANLETMVELIKETESAEREGIHLSTKPMPSTAEVISD